MGNTSSQPIVTSQPWPDLEEAGANNAQLNYQSSIISDTRTEAKGRLPSSLPPSVSELSDAPATHETNLKVDTKFHTTQQSRKRKRRRSECGLTAGSEMKARHKARKPSITPLNRTGPSTDRHAAPRELLHLKATEQWPEETHGSLEMRAEHKKADTANQVQGWLDSQELSIADSCRQPAQPRERGYRRRDRGCHDDHDAGDHNCQPAEEDEMMNDVVEPADRDRTGAQAAQDQGRVHGGSHKSGDLTIARTPSSQLPHVLEDGPTGGAFSKIEHAITEATFNSCCMADDISAYDLKVLIIDWKKLGTFKTAMETALPNRNRTSVRKFCQRKYNCNETGKWTEAQDQALREQHTQQPAQWACISDFVGRSAQDCRDRWKHHLKYGDKMEAGPWSQEDEGKLMVAVQECIDLIKLAEKENKELVNDRETLERMINFESVSKKLQGRRSAKRCRDKWRQLKRREVTGSTKTSTTTRAVELDDSSDSLKRAQRKLKLFGPGDIWDVLTEIHTSVSDHSANFGLESTFWSLVAVKNNQSRFDGALRRCAYRNALEMYGNGDVSAASTIATKAKLLAGNLEDRMQRSGNDLSRGYFPSKRDGKTKVTRKKGKSKMRREIKAAERSTYGLSAEFVEDTDDEDEHVARSTGNDRSRVNQRHGEDETAAERVGHPPTRHKQPHSLNHTRSSLSRCSEDGEGGGGEPTSTGVHVASESEEVLSRQGALAVKVDEDDILISSVNSRAERPSTGSTGKPNLSPEEFLARCEEVGRMPFRGFAPQEGVYLATRNSARTDEKIRRKKKKNMRMKAKRVGVVG